MRTMRIRTLTIIIRDIFLFIYQHPPSGARTPIQCTYTLYNRMYWYTPFKYGNN